jgi:hypothetical protein
MTTTTMLNPCKIMIRVEFQILSVRENREACSLEGMTRDTKYATMQEKALTVLGESQC